MFRRLAKKGLDAVKNMLTADDIGVGYGVSEFEDFERLREEARQQDVVEGNVTAGAEMDAIAEGTREIGAEDLRVLLEVEDVEDHPVILDVRTAHEWGQGHLENAMHIPLQELEDRWKELPHGRPVITYCASGMRSIDASYVLKRQGFDDVRSLAGGITAWAQAGNVLVH